MALPFPPLPLYFPTGAPAWRAVVPPQPERPSFPARAGDGRAALPPARPQGCPVGCHVRRADTDRVLPPHPVLCELGVPAYAHGLWVCLVVLVRPSTFCCNLRATLPLLPDVSLVCYLPIRFCVSLGFQPMRMGFGYVWLLYSSEHCFLAARLSLLQFPLQPQIGPTIPLLPAVSLVRYLPIRLLASLGFQPMRMGFGYIWFVLFFFFWQRPESPCVSMATDGCAIARIWADLAFRSYPSSLLLDDPSRASLFLL